MVEIPESNCSSTNSLLKFKLNRYMYQGIGEKSFFLKILKHIITYEKYH